MQQELLFENFYDHTPCGKGNFAEVFRVKNKATNDKYYALKMIITRDLIHEKNLQEEIIILKDLQSEFTPNAILKFYGFHKEVSTSGQITYHLIFDYCSNSLKQIIKELKNNKQVPFPFKKLLSVAKSLLNALSFLQLKKIWVQNIKPNRLGFDEFTQQIYMFFGSSGNQL